MRFIIISVLLFGFSCNSFAEDWSIGNKSKTKKILFYKDSKVAELLYNGSWSFYCENGRSGGNVNKKFDYLRTATKNAMTVCDKF